MALRIALKKNVMTTSAFSNMMGVNGSRMLSDTWKDKEHAAEAAYFNKEDERALRKLLKKMKSQTDKVDASGREAHKKYDTEGLDKITKGLGLSKDTIEALLKWKHDEKH